MNNWQPYPQKKPDNTLKAQEADYVVLIANPFYVNKQGVVHNIPRHRVELAIWCGSHWLPVDADYIGEHTFDVKYFIQLPPHN